MSMNESTTGTRGTGSARVLTILAFVFAAVAVAFFPIVFGPVAIVLAAIAMRKGDPLARWALIAAIAGMVAGFVLGAVLYSAAD
jgi:cytochrome c biogenesis protein CcdA